MVRADEAGAAVRIAATIAITTSLLALRIGLLPIVPAGYPFLLSFLALLLCTAMFTAGAGLLSMLISIGVAAWLFPPAHSLRIERLADMVALGMFCGVGLVTTLILEAMHHGMAELRRAERRAASTLHEYRHRTRNDLARLAALLLLRARLIASAEGKAGLREAADQARQLAMVHSHLSHAAYDPDGEPDVEAAALVEGICRDLGPPLPRVVACTGRLPTDRGVILGLLLVELVRAGRRRGTRTVEVRLIRHGPEWRLRVTDGTPTGNGPGLDGLQRRMVDGLAVQLHGRVVNAIAPDGRRYIEAAFPVEIKPMVARR
jgi:two-component system, sensor histidine kinase PdtaS